MIMDHDLTSKPMTYKELHRAWKSLPNHGKKEYEEWVGGFFTRAFFVRLMWSLRKHNPGKYRRVLRADWKAVTGPWIRHRKMWRKYMAGYSTARAPE